MKKDGIAEQYDKGYRLLFSFPRMVEDLLRQFVAETWVERLDFTTLDKMSERDISSDLIRREKDLLWRLRYRADENGPGGWFHFYIHLEFQSTPRPFMPVDILAYKTLLYQDLVRRNALTDSGKLPPVFSIVLYNGKPGWSVPLSLIDMIEPVPSDSGVVIDAESVVSYRLIGEKGYTAEELNRGRTPVATLFRLEQSCEAEDLRRGLTQLKEELPGPENDRLREAFAAYVREALLQVVAPGVVIPELTDLTEYNGMLKERAIEWRESWREEGRQEGLQEGEAKVLGRVLTMKFGPLSAKVRARLGAATPAELLAWVDRALTAETIDQVFQS